jgi:serine O-acetyltransferase
MIGTIQLILSKLILKPLLIKEIPPIYYLGLFLREVLLLIFKCDISPLASVPLSTKFPHFVGIVIGSCTIGENCVIRPNVVIGRKDLEEKNESLAQKKKKFPTIGSNVIIGANVSILGPIYIGSNAIIGANSLVITNVEENSIYGGVPAKKIGEVLSKRFTT